MKALFKNLTYFTYLYIFVFLMDTVVKVLFPLDVLRYLTKAFLIGVLLYYYIVNNNEINKRNVRLIVFALSAFLIGDTLITAGSVSRYFFILGVVFFCVGKILYGIRFSNQKDFNILKLVPFLLFCFSYMCFVMIIIYDKLENYFFPVLFYLFIVMLTAQFAYLRRYEVNRMSYILVLIGVIFSMFSDSITLLKEFYNASIAYNQYTIMFFYGLSQYFIIVGIVKENNGFNKLKEL